MHQNSKSSIELAICWVQVSKRTIHGHTEKLYLYIYIYFPFLCKQVDLFVKISQNNTCGIVSLQYMQLPLEDFGYKNWNKGKQLQLYTAGNKQAIIV
jgi:hypothetical protein